MNTVKDRRQHRRYTAIENILALNTESFGKVVDMSLGGLRIKYLLRRGDPFHHDFDISLLNDTGEHYIDKLPCKVVSITDSRPICPPLNLFIREAGVAFTGLSVTQKNLLSHFIVYNSIASA